MYIVERLLYKAKEAFVMAIEVYNKPTIKYRLEGFSFFICNVWELMLKAHMINQFGESSIYYKDKPNRTIALEKCIEKIFTNKTAPLRQNLEKIIELRNTSTHFITEEYEMVYVPLLQACVFNFVEKMKQFHAIDMAEIIPENFITLSVRINAHNETEIRAKYTRQVSEKLINIQQSLAPLIDSNNSSFSVKIEHNYILTKKKDEATELYHISSDAEDGVRIIKEIKDPNDTHKYNAKGCLKEINKQLSKSQIILKYGEKNLKAINMHHFQMFLKYFDIKNNPKPCYVYKNVTQPLYSYSMQAIELIVNELKKSPETILDDLKQKLKKNKKLTPGAKDSKHNAYSHSGTQLVPFTS